MIAVIMAGGRGTRIQEINKELPKPMICIAGKPILAHIIGSLKEQGITEIILVIGYKADIIKKYFGDGRKQGVPIKYIVEEVPLGTAGALYYLKQDIKEEFLLVNGDIIFDVDIQGMLHRHKEKEAVATIFTHPNSHPYDSGIIVSDKEDRVTEWINKEDPRGWNRNRVNAGIHMISPKLLDSFDELKKMDLDRDVLKPLIQTGKLYCYDSPEYVKDAGTPERFYKVETDLIRGIVGQRNLRNKQKAVFLDRDGTMNKHVGFLRKIEKFELLEKVTEAIGMINDSEYLAIVITNQPVLARGEVTISELELIHHKMETLLGAEGAYVDDIFYCPHHPDKGYEGEISELKIDCHCRKPKPGLLHMAAEKYNIDLAQSWMVGDSESDMQAGVNAGCLTAYIGEENFESNIDLCRLNLYDCIRYILGK